MATATDVNNSVVVAVQQGKIRGRRKKVDTYSNLNYYSFQGIPYAKPPIGKLRFKAPQPPEKWSGIRDATEEPSECYSLHLLMPEMVGSEDCLYLNVYTPDIQNSSTNPKPVMFWIHGGGFTQGSSKTEMYGPDYLVQNDVILVTINYRLGVLGFLSMSDPTVGVPGNAGLKDMVMALKWVKYNIRQFCGDPENVTIFGESAGAAAVHYLILSPMAKGLFHKAIMQSGCALNPWARGRRCVHELAKALGFENDDDKAILKFLQSLTLEELFKGVAKIKDVLSAGIIRPFGPVVELFSDEPPFLPQDPITIIKSGRYNKVPLMIGYTSREGMMPYTTFETKDRLLDDDTIVPYMLNLPRNSHVYKTVLEEIKHFYLKNESSQNIDGILKMYTDNLFRYDISSIGKLHANKQKLPVYFYRFSMETHLNFVKQFYMIDEPGACHGDDLSYLFKVSISVEIAPDSVEDTAMKRVTKLWTNFAKYGNPTPGHKDELLPVTWKSLTSTDVNILDIGDNLKMVKDPERAADLFWKNLFKSKRSFSKL